jgi:hypothetical protein
MENKIKNSFWFRHFLICNELAKKIISARGWHVDNFAETILESQNGMYGNDQMNIYFEIADEFFSDLHTSDSNEVFNELENEDLPIEKLAQLSAKEIDYYFKRYCAGTIDFSNTITNE